MAQWQQIVTAARRLSFFEVLIRGQNLQFGAQGRHIYLPFHIHPACAQHEDKCITQACLAVVFGSRPREVQSTTANRCQPMPNTYVRTRGRQVLFVSEDRLLHISPKRQARIRLRLISSQSCDYRLSGLDQGSVPCPPIARMNIQLEWPP